MMFKALLSWCLDIILSTTQRGHCQQNVDESTMIYSVKNKVYAKNLHDDRPRKFIDFKGHVSGLAWYKNYLFVKIKGSNAEYTSIRRVILSPNSINIKVKKDSETTF